MALSPGYRGSPTHARRTSPRSDPSSRHRHDERAMPPPISHSNHKSEGARRPRAETRGLHALKTASQTRFRSAEVVVKSEGPTTESSSSTHPPRSTPPKILSSPRNRGNPQNPNKPKPQPGRTISGINSTRFYKIEIQTNFKAAAGPESPASAGANFQPARQPFPFNPKARSHP